MSNDNDFNFSRYFKVFTASKKPLAGIESPVDIFRMTINSIYGDAPIGSIKRRDEKKIHDLNPFSFANPFNFISAIAYFIDLGIRVGIDKIDKKITGNAVHIPSSTPAAVVKTILTFPFSVTHATLRSLTDGAQYLTGKLFSRATKKKVAKTSDIELDEPQSTSYANSILKEKESREVRQSRSVVSDSEHSGEEALIVRASAVKGTTFSKAPKRADNPDEKELAKKRLRRF